MNSRILVTAVTIVAAFATYAADEIVPRNDQEFATKMAQGGMCEVKASEMAQRKSSNASIKSFADMMVSEHSKANAELSSLADKKGWTLPQQLDDKHQSKIDMLQAATSGATFDQEYAGLMAKSHNKAAELFRSASSTAQDADFKAWATTTLAMIEKHQSQANDLAASVGATPDAVKASFREVQPAGTGTTTTTQDAQRQTNRAPNGGTIIDNNPTTDNREATPEYQAPKGKNQVDSVKQQTPATTTTTQDATKLTNRAPND